MDPQFIFETYLCKIHVLFQGHDFSVVDRSILQRPRLYESEAGSPFCLIFEILKQAEWIGLPKSPQFCPVLRETASKLPSPYVLPHLTSFPSSPHEIHTQHRVVAFCLTYKSKLSYTHTSKGSSSTHPDSCLGGIDWKVHRGD